MKPIRNVLACLALLACMSQAQAQFVQVYSPPIVPTVSYYAPPVFSAPVVNYYQPTVAYSAPAQVNYSYYQPTVAYSAPVVGYSAPVVAYSAPAVQYAAPGYYTTQTYTGYGIFRPRGTYTQTYYTPYWR